MAFIMRKKEQQLRIRPMLESDIKRVIEVEKRAYEYPWTRGIFQDCIRAGYSCWVANKGNRVRGYGVLSVAAGESHILNVCVDPGHQGNGYGRALVLHLMEVAKNHQAEVIYLEVRPSNKIAYQLYLSIGFNEVGHRKDYYPSKNGREDGLIMAFNF